MHVLCTPGTFSAESANSFKDAIGVVVEGDNGFFRVAIDGRSVMWILANTRDLQVRHRAPVATLYRLREQYCWPGIEKHVMEFVEKCLHCMGSKSGEVVPRPFGETVHERGRDRCFVLTTCKLVKVNLLARMDSTKWTGMRLCS